MSVKEGRYYVTQKIGGQQHYFSHWERLTSTSREIFPVWQEYIHFSNGFPSKTEARKMKSILDRFSKGGPRVENIVKWVADMERKKSFQKLGNVN